MTPLQTAPFAYVFPGQGAQFVGMGAALLEQSERARATLAEADVVLGVPLSELIANGPAETLEDTINAQPAILAISIAAHRALTDALLLAGARATPAMVAGHSLGELSAIVAAGSLSYHDALQLVRERGRLMKEAGATRPGGMAAVLGLDDAQLEAVCAEAARGGIVVLANANCPGQTVISGEIEPLERAMTLAKERGAKRVARLNVSIASHSPLMRDAAARFAERLHATPFGDPMMPVIGNVDAQPLTTAEEIKAELVQQMERPVQWTRSVETMIAGGVRTFVEVGPGAVLAGLIKRIDREVTTVGLGDLGLGLPSLAK